MPELQCMCVCVCMCMSMYAIVGKHDICTIYEFTCRLISLYVSFSIQWNIAMVMVVTRTGSDHEERGRYIHACVVSNQL